MKNLMNSIPAGHIGEVLALPGDYSAHDGLRRSAEFGGVPMSTYNPPFPDNPEPLWEQEPVGDLRYKLGSWIAAHVDVILSPAYLSRQPVHHTTGRIVLLAAMDAAQETGQPKIILQAHGPNSIPGQWIAADGHTDLLVLVPDGAPLAATTYSALTVNPGIQSAQQVNPETFEVL